MRPPLVIVAAVVAAAALLASACSSDSGSSSSPPSTAVPTTLAPSDSVASADTVELTAQTEADCPREGEELDTAKLYIEHNATDGDTGVHGLFGGEAWSQLCIWDPSGELIFWVDPRNQLDDLTVADFFFESREPENTELPIAELTAAFPEGDYLVGGIDFEGVPRVASARFTHAIPAEPVITDPPLVEDPESVSEAVVPAAGLVVTWEPVTETVDGQPVTVTAYEVIVTNDEHDDADGLSRPVYDVHVGPDQTSLSVPEEFFSEGVIYELEVLALEDSGNQTIGLGFFTVA
ncbi:MAG: hypothetical protein OES57_02720 [Acidimicrobiia bacterium]|nr:hypothetical protein [Acidimicrobiia bacterium]